MVFIRFEFIIRASYNRGNTPFPSVENYCYYIIIMISCTFASLYTVESIIPEEVFMPKKAATFMI